MGSIFKTSTPRYTPMQYTPPKTVVTQPVTPSKEDGGEDDTAKKAQDTIRRVARNRGVGSTILTSFRGVLGNQSSLAPQRKNLLGE